MVVVPQWPTELVLECGLVWHGSGVATTVAVGGGRRSGCFVMVMLEEWELVVVLLMLVV
jgi:hypothetical protein